MRLPALLLACAAVTAVTAAAPAALAQGRGAPQPSPIGQRMVDPRMAEAKRLFEEGAASYAQGYYDAAIKAWEQSYQISGKPLILESIANAWERLGDARKARDYLTRWRNSAPAEERDLLEARIRNLDARVSREDDVSRKAAADKAASDAALQAAQQEHNDPRPWLVGASVAGGGVLAVVAGVAVDVVASTKRPDASLCKVSAGLTLCNAAAQGPITTSSRLALAGDITWAVGAAAVAAGAALIFLRRAPVQQDGAPAAAAATHPRGQPAAWLAPAPGGVMVGGRF